MKKILVLIAGLSVVGCASIIDGGDQNINIISSDADADVSAIIATPDGVMTTSLPTIVHTSRSGDDIIIHIEEDDCYRETVQVAQSSVNPLILGNVITGVFLGSTTDFASGAAWEYDDMIIVHPAKKDSCNK